MKKKIKKLQLAGMTNTENDIYNNNMALKTGKTLINYIN